MKTKYSVHVTEAREFYYELEAESDYAATRAALSGQHVATQTSTRTNIYACKWEPQPLPSALTATGICEAEAQVEATTPPVTAESL